MNKHQIRAIRNSFKRDIIHLKNSGYGGEGLIDYPLMRKSLKDIVIRGKKITDKMILHCYRLTKGKNVYDKYAIYYCDTYTMYVILLNGKIIYWCTSSISAPGWAAWHILTEVYHGTRKDNVGIWEWLSVEDFDCCCMYLVEETKRDWNLPCLQYYHSEYQNKKFAETGLSFIDKRIITQEEANRLADKEYYHT